MTYYILAVLLSACVGTKPAPAPEPGPTPVQHEPWTVMAKETPDGQYAEYKAVTVDRLSGFTPGDAPETDKYGGWKAMTLDVTGYFHVQKAEGRWWVVSPEGHPLISAQVANFVPNASARGQQAMSANFNTLSRWASSEMYWLKSKGFTGVCGSSSTIVSLPSKIAYTAFINPMTMYSREVKKTYSKIPSNMPVVFDDGYDQVLSEHVSWLNKYATDPWCFGVTTDDELLWTDDMLKHYLQTFPSGNANRKAAQAWLDERKGKTGATLSDADASDIDAFKAYCLETYLRRTSSAVKLAVPNLMYMGTRFYKWTSELASQAMMAAAGTYVDLISINHFTKWEPDAEAMANWTEWSGKPFMITSFDVKGEDSGLPNTGGLGWVVPTQEDRGRFYENFVIKLVASKVCVGWQWYTYQDNDPEDTTADASNKDSNKGLVAWDFSRYDAFVDHVAAANAQLYNLTQFYK